MSRPSPPAAHSSTVCPDSNRFTVQGTSALHVPGRIPFGTATVTAYARLSRFTDFALSVRVAASHTSSAMSTAPCTRSEEHTSELQSPCNLVCRLLLEKKKKNIKNKPLLNTS